MNVKNSPPLLEACLGKSSASSLLDNTVISRQTHPLRTRIKVITSGKIMEVYYFAKPILVGQSLIHYKKMELLTEYEIANILNDPKKYGESGRSEEYKQRNVSRSRNKIRRLVQNNFDNVSKFLTLTFKDTTKFDVTSLSDCVDRYQYFIKKLHSKYPDVKNLSVPEFQDKNGRGAVHFHSVIDLPFVPVSELRKLWRYGFIKINKIYSPELVGIYVAKYLGKNAGDKRFEGHRTFYASNNLTQPVIRYDDAIDHNLEHKIEALEARGITPSFTNSYYSDWCGKVTYKSYNLYQLPAQETEKNESD